jgi:uncharacterized membrane protein (UPF0136 family)
MDPRKLRQGKMAMTFGFALVFVGTFMPWADFDPFTETGLDREGVIILLLATAGGVIGFFERRPRGMLIATSCGAVCIAASLINIIDIAGSPAAIGIGLYFTAFGAVLATVAGGALAFSLFKRPAAERPAPPDAEPPQDGPTT